MCSSLLLLHRESTLQKSQLTPRSSDLFPLYLKKWDRRAEVQPHSNTVWAGQTCPLATSTAVLVQAASPGGC